MREKQISESKRLIVDGFFSLLDEIDYSKVTMSNIAEKAMVSRMTLYRYFNSKKDIISYFMSGLIQSVKHELATYEGNKLYFIILKRNEFIYYNQYLRIAFKNNDVMDIVKEISENNKLIFKEHLPTLREDNFKRSFIEGGIIEITNEWIRSDFCESPEEITKKTIKLIQLVI